MKSPLAVFFALLVIAVLTGATGVALLWGAGPTLLFVSTCSLAAAVVILRGVARG